MPTYQMHAKTILFCLFLFSSPFLSAQKSFPRHAAIFTGGYARHGSGDLKGIVFGTSFKKYLTNKFGLDFNLRSDIDYGRDKIILNNPTTGERKDQSIRYTTAGLQLGVNGQLSFIRTAAHEILFSLGAFGRFQSASNGSDGYSLYYPNQTGIPTVLVEYNVQTPANTFALGGIVQFQYNFTLKNQFVLGISPAFQTDTNGDAIPEVAVIIAKRF